MGITISRAMFSLNAKFISLPLQHFTYNRKEYSNCVLTLNMEMVRCGYE